MDKISSSSSFLEQLKEQMEIISKLNERIFKQGEKIINLEERNLELEVKNKKILKQLETLQSKKTFYFKNNNTKLSDHAQDAIENSDGPLNKHEFFAFLMNDVFDKNNKGIILAIRKYSQNIDGVRKQLLQVLENVKTYMTYRRKQSELDIKLITILKDLDKKIVKEFEIENNLKSTTTPSVQGGSGRCLSIVLPNNYQGKSYEAVETSCQNSSRLQVVEKSDKIAGRVQEEQTVFNNKRKLMNDAGSSSKQEHNVESRFRKRFQLDSCDHTTDSSQSTELMSVDSNTSDSQHTDRMSVDEHSSQHTYPISMILEQSIRKSTKTMATASSSKLNNQSNSTPENLTRQNIKKKEVPKNSNKCLRSTNKVWAQRGFHSLK